MRNELMFGLSKEIIEKEITTLLGNEKNTELTTLNPFGYYHKTAMGLKVAVTNGAYDNKSMNKAIVDIANMIGDEKLQLVSGGKYLEAMFFLDKILKNETYIKIESLCLDIERSCSKRTSRAETSLVFDHSLLKKSLKDKKFSLELIKIAMEQRAVLLSFFSMQLSEVRDIKNVLFELINDTKGKYFKTHAPAELFDSYDDKCMNVIYRKTTFWQGVSMAVR